MTFADEDQSPRPPAADPASPRRRDAAGRLALEVMGVTLGAMVILGGLTVWHIRRRARWMRERLPTPPPRHRATLADPDQSDI